ncbi:PREDICTED: exocyst complex component 4 [Nicrophorus vespilloides]|uniref:Exocyst complex component Sec8 n=1 Tax=Nicrophorus vespilloides TaxID=110193 RepID=A0ABM1MQX3_NICVS|nr:PREDICTED: exocyst complex component 4 [Nicrophorus vespilloides]
MDNSPPIKPPRGVKPIKETSGLLMSVIRTLSASETNEQREREKAKLELEYELSDKKLGELVSKHESDLTQVMQVFGTLSQLVSDSRQRIHKVKTNLEECKKLLYCKKDDLQKKWMEGLEYKYVLQFLDEIEKMKEVPKQLSDHMMRKQYLHATELLVQAVTLGKDRLSKVEALKELTAELEQKKEQLHIKLMQELKQHIYLKTSQKVLMLRRQGSSREGLFNSPLQRSLELRISSRQKSNIRKNLLDSSKLNTSSNDFDVVEDIDVLDPESDSTHFMAILVKSLALLEKIPFSVNELQTEMQNELMHIVQKTTHHIYDYNSLQSVDTKTKYSALVELVQTIFDQFKQIGQAHIIVLDHFSKASKCHNVDVNLYSIKNYWAQVQGVLQLMLNDYLDIQNITSDPQLNDSFTNPNDISSYFSRRKPQSKKKSFFKFDGSTSALTMNEFKDSQVNNKKKDKILLCPADPNNILHIFVPFMCFIEDIEQILELQQGAQCPLHKFLSDYVTDRFVTRRHIETLRKIEDTVRMADAWKSTVLLDITTDYKPLLVSTVTVEKFMKEWRTVLESLPLYGETIIKYVCNALRDYRETCNAAYAGIVQPHSEDRRICSAAWLKDEDISRFLKSLPNWQNLKAQQEYQARNERRKTVRREHTMEEESPEEIRQRNRREAEILASNLGEGGVGAGEILSDMNLLKELAQLQESMEWFSVQMFQFASDFRQDPTLSPTTNALDASVTISPNTLQQLTSVAQDFDELANTCLLLLHLEVRVQCFHYLLAQSDYNKETHEPDPKVLELSRVLANVDEAMTSSLHPRKCKYIFEGLGHLIAKILISSSQYMKNIDEGGIQRMCRNVFALQQTLTNITMTREVALDHARHYFELFFLTPEEILNGIVENGPEFSELEYINAFQLLSRSSNGSNQNSVNAYQKRLTSILGEVGVTV